MKAKMISIIAVLGFLLSVSMMPMVRANGPATENLLIRVYANEISEFADLSRGIVDITDWPGTAYYIDQWRMDPNVQMRSYAEIGIMLLDINNQRWPTGWDTPKEYDPRTDSYKHYFNESDPNDPNCRRDWAARHFRTAIAYLCDKARYVTEILLGYAYPMETFVPVPALEGYTDYPGLESKGLIYHYSRTKAIETLEAGGFRDWDNDGIREWKDPGPDMTFGTSDDGAIEELPTLKFYIRMDDSNRMRAGLLLADELTWAGIPVNKIVTERSVCWRQVMVFYDFHLYTAGWSLGAVPDWLYTIWGSEYYWAPTGWSTNYDGFCDKEYDDVAYKVYTATSPEELHDNALLAQERFAYLAGAVPWWCAAAVKAFRTGWNGVVNDVGYGTDNYYSFFIMEKAGDNTIDYGYKSDAQDLHVICSQWVWDWNALGLVYESLIGRSPYNKAIGVYDYWLATGYTIGEWQKDGKPATMVNFTIRSGVKWQDGTDFTAADVVFSLEFTRHCGSGVAWNFAAVQNLNETFVDPADPNKVVVKLNVLKSVTGQEDPGFLPIIPKHIWETQFPDWQSWYNETTGEWVDVSVRLKVRDWKPYKESWTGPNGISMTKMFGTGAWIFKQWISGESLSFVRNTNHYFTVQNVRDLVSHEFWKYMGDVNKNLVVDGTDLARLHASWSSGVYDPDCDFNEDGAVNATDHFLLSKNFGRTG
jgi:ABC-type transport system substrate-binding protein